MKGEILPQWPYVTGHSIQLRHVMFTCMTLASLSCGSRYVTSDVHIINRCVLIHNFMVTYVFLLIVIRCHLGRIPRRVSVTITDISVTITDIIIYIYNKPTSVYCTICFIYYIYCFVKKWRCYEMLCYHYSRLMAARLWH